MTLESFCTCAFAWHPFVS